MLVLIGNILLGHLGLELSVLSCVGASPTLCLQVVGCLFLRAFRLMNGTKDLLASSSSCSFENLEVVGVRWSNFGLRLTFMQLSTHELKLVLVLCSSNFQQAKGRVRYVFTSWCCSFLGYLLLVRSGWVFTLLFGCAQSCDPLASWCKNSTNHIG
jgi:hypothetical protein